MYQGSAICYECHPVFTDLHCYTYVTPKLGSHFALTSAAAVWCHLSFRPIFYRLYLPFLCPLNILVLLPLLTVERLEGKGVSEFPSYLPT